MHSTQKPIHSANAFSLLQLSAPQLRQIAASQIPAEFAPRIEDDALPPVFVAERALAMLEAGVAEVWASSFMIIRERDGRIVGACGFKSAPVGGRVEIGYAVSPACQREGAATEAVKLLLRTAFQAGAREVLAEILPDNMASLRVVKKAGFHPIGAGVDKDGEYVLQWLARAPA